MPILPLEPYLFPEGLFADASVSLPSGGRWWALHTKPRAEKSLARHLLRDAVPFFLPLHRKMTPVRGRPVPTHLPLFPGYVFLHADDDGRLQALTTNLIVHCLPVPNQTELMTDLTGIHRLMTCEQTVTAEDGLPPGTPVEIIAGPLAGLRGVVVREARKLKFVVEVHFLRRGAWVEIDAASIAPVVRGLEPYAGAT